LRKFIILTIRLIFTVGPFANSYPIYAQQNYKNPREASGRIVCANCHLAQGPVQIDVPQAVLPGIVFEAKVRIPHDYKLTQVLGNGNRGGLNLGAVLILPAGFQLAPQDRLSVTQKKETKGLYFQPYSRNQKNIVVVGPVPAKTHREIIFPILAPDVDKEKIRYGKYPIYLGGNRGRGQLYPDGSKSNNTVYTSTRTGVIKDIVTIEKKGGFKILIDTVDGNLVTETVPAGPTLLVKPGQSIRVDRPLTNNPNIGGYGQSETEIVLQDPKRVQRLILFFGTVFLTQVILVLKKKQFEKFQLADLNFLFIYIVKILLPKK
jgi:apocytochrome f